MLIDGTYYHNGFVVSYEYVMQWEKEQGNLINIYNRSDEIPNVGKYANWDNFSKGNSEGQFIAGDPTKFVVPPPPKFLQAPKSEQSCYQDPFATLINNIADGNFILALEQLTEGGPSSLIATVPLIGFGEAAFQESKIYGSLTERFGASYKSVAKMEGTYLPLNFGQKLNQISPGCWSKMFEAGWLDGAQVEIHYYFNSVTGEYYNPFIAWKGWGSF